MTTDLTNSSLIKKPIFLWTLFLIFVAISSCSQGRVDPFDLQTGATKTEIKNSFFGDKTKKPAKDIALAKPVAIPQSARMITIPSFANVKSEKLISFSVTDQVPLKDVLIELAKAAKIDLDLDPNISGGVIINAKNRPLTEVLDRICDMGNLRYTLSDKYLHVERDLPFAKNYSLDFLIDGELWKEVETNIGALLNSKSSGSNSSGGSVSSNKLSNMMTIFASQKDHIKVASYLEQARKSSSAQVLIEAKVVEVTLSDSYKTGIDWSWVAGQNTTKFTGGGTDANPLTFVAKQGSLLLGRSINLNISALEEFGTVKAISSPRINALNNQKATLNFTKKLVYFTSEAAINSTTSTSGTNTASNITSTKHEENTGTELNIVPTIDLASGEITLNVKPKITIKSGEVSQIIYASLPDPKDTTKSAIQPITNQIPVINVRELNTIAKIQSGSVLVIGGVMSEDTANNDKGIPFLSRIPVLGFFFKSTSKLASVTETVIFIKATIIGTADGASKYDRQLSDTFTSSSRPFFNSN